MLGLSFYTIGMIAERHPGLKLIVDHMGVPRASKGEAAYRFQSPKRTYALSRQDSAVSWAGTRPTFPRTGSLDRREGKPAIFDEPKSAVSKPVEGKWPTNQLAQTDTSIGVA